MTLEHYQKGKATVVKVRGDVRVGASEQSFRGLIRDLIAAGHKSIVVDFSEVGFIDSTGLGDLAGLRATAVRAGGSLKLSGLSKRMHDLLVLTRMDLVFEMYETEDEAAASF